MRRRTKKYSIRPNRQRGLSKTQKMWLIAALVLLTNAFLSVSLIYNRRPSLAAPGPYKPLGTYTYWYGADYPASIHNTIENTLMLETDPTLTVYKIGYFYATQFFGAGQGGYFGIQTNGEAGTYRGKVAIFSMWGGIAAEGQQPDWCQVVPSGFDGNPDAYGATCRIPLDWHAGDTYRMKMTTILDEETGRTWEATLRNESTGQEQLIGRIKSNLRGLLQASTINWTEFYSAERAECDAPYSNVIFGRLITDGQPATSHWNDYGVVDGCTNSAITQVSGGMRQEQSIPLAPDPAPLPTGGTYISDLPWVSATTEWSTVNRDIASNGSPMKINNVLYTKGIGTHADSEIVYDLAGQYSRFVSYIGLDDTGAGDVTFEVWADGVKLYNSPIMNSQSRTEQVNVNVTGKQTLRLVLTDAGNGNTSDAGDWADARLMLYAPDTIPPTVNFTNPINGATVKNNKVVHVTSNITDNEGISRVDLYVDGTLTGSSTAAPYTINWNPKKASLGNHTLELRATDTSDNIGSQTITVTVTR